MHYQGNLNSLLTVGMAFVIVAFVVVAKIMMRREKRRRSSGIGNAFLVIEAANPEVSHVLQAKKNNVQRRHRKKTVGSNNNK